MQRRIGALAAAAAALVAGLLAFRRRPVKPPVHKGEWEPVER